MADGVRAVFVRPGGRLEYRTVEPGRQSIRLAAPMPAFSLGQMPAPSSFNVPAEDYQWIGRVVGSAPAVADGQLMVYALEGSGYKLIRSRSSIAGIAVATALAVLFDRAFNALPLDADPMTAIGIAARVLPMPSGGGYSAGLTIEAWTVARSIEHVAMYGRGQGKPAGLMAGGR